MKYLLLPLLIVLFFTSCSNDTEKKEATSDKEIADNQEQKQVEETDQLEVNVEPEIDSVWNYYAGSVGTYDSPVIMELSFNGSDVTGNYWYAKHKKKISLKGEYDSKTQEVKLDESVKGKVTGHFKFKVDQDGLQGTWSKPNSKSEGEYFYCNIMKKEVKKHMQPEFNEYELAHDIEVYNPEKDDFEFQDSKDYCSITNIGNDQFIIIYDVVGHNYHTGSISGTGKYLTPKLGQFVGEEGCELSIKFFDKEIIIEEEANCDYYKGHRAYFGGTLTKIKN